MLSSEDRLSPLRAHHTVETAYLAATTAMLWLGLYYLPLGGPLFRLALPLPLILLHLRHGKDRAIEGITATSLLLIVLMGPVRGSLVLFPYGSLAIWLGWGWKYRLNWWITWGIGIIIGSIGFLIRLNILSLLLDENLWLVITHSTTDLLEYILTFLKFRHIPSLWQIQIMTISLILLQNFLYIFSLHVIAYWVFPRLGVNISEPPEFIQFLVNFEHI